MADDRLSTVPTEARKGHRRGSLSQYAVPIFFTVLCVASIIVSDLDINYLIGELLSRMGRNLFIVLSLLIPVTAGIG
ncbi:MAG: hypothetical protein KBB09_05920, partial [Firmicutes bacterium]|nr:hypothetical protein [Bacillota bacterium]